MKFASQQAWKILTIIGLIFVGWGIYQMVVVPMIGKGQWDSLTSDPDVIEYIIFWFRNHGIWTTANGLFFVLITATAFKTNERWAWWALAYLPVHIIFITTQFVRFWFISLPLIILSIWLLTASRSNLRPAPETERKFGWVFFFIVGLGFLYWAYDNIFVIPTLDTFDRDRPWDWLTTDPEILDYIKFYFRVFGVRVLAFGMLTLLTAYVGLREGSRWAWKILFIVPILVGAHIFIWPWTAPILITVILFSAMGLWLSYPKRKVLD